MSENTRLKIAIQKKGRLNNDSMDLLIRCGLKIRTTANSLFYHAENLPIDLLLVRDDDIPTLVMNNLCDLGIVGENTLLEKALYENNQGNGKSFDVAKKLGFSRCRLSIALPHERPYVDNTSLQGLRIATSYPHLLSDYCDKNNIQTDILTISGSVEIAPRLNMSDAICDLVSSGRTLEENGLKEVSQVIASEAVLIKSKTAFTPEKAETFEILLRRIHGVLQAQESKYILFHAPKAALAAIKSLLPGFESPTIMPLEGDDDKVAVHVVSSEGVFWSTLEKLKDAGASSILVLPIEKMLH